ncbi:MAG: helix-turn-helix domain-containing protein [Bryobacteraceae bacterium]
MATAAFAPTLTRRISLAQIDAAVSARLGPTRIPGNAQPACFNRQIAMYLARHIGHWSTTVIGRFYNGRDHSTVCHGIQRIEALRETDPDVDALIADLKNQILESNAGGGTEHQDGPVRASYSEARLERLADLISERVCEYLETRLQRCDSKRE